MKDGAPLYYRVVIPAKVTTEYSDFDSERHVPNNIVEYIRLDYYEYRMCELMNLQKQMDKLHVAMTNLFKIFNDGERCG